LVAEQSTSENTSPGLFWYILEWYILESIKKNTPFYIYIHPKLSKKAPEAEQFLIIILG